MINRLEIQKMALFCVIFLLMVGCNSREREMNRLLEEIDLKEKNGLPLVDDSLFLQEAYRFFHENNNTLQQIRTLFYRGSLQEEAGHYQVALVLFKEATMLAEESKDLYWQSYLYSKLGFLYMKEYNVPTAQDYLDLALQTGRDIAPSISDIGYQLQFGRSFLFSGHPELALSYFESIRPLIRHADSRYTKLYRSMGLAYSQLHQYDSAIEAINISLHDETDPEYKMICEMALLEMAINRKDKAAIDKHKAHIDLLLPDVLNLDLHQEYYRICSLIYAGTGDYKQAFDEMSRSYFYEDNKLTHLGRLSVDEGVLKRYQEKMSFENKELKSGKRWLGFSILGSWVLTATVALVVKKKRQRKYFDFEQKIELLEEMAKRNNGETADLKGLIIRDLEIIKRIALYKSQHSRDSSFVDQFNRLVTVDKHNPFELEWQKLYTDVDRLYDGFYTKLQTFSSDFTEKELQLCCLMKIGFKTDEVAAIWDQSVYSVQKYRSNVRRKLKTPEGADIIEYLKERGC
ncbi:MAG: hypothetical protein RR212_10490 [Bacteroidales bacterium]